MHFLPVAQNKTNNYSSKLPRGFKDRIVIALFLLPALVLFLTFVIYPIYRSIYYSTFDWKGFGLAVDYVGLENYRKIFSDEVFLKAIKNVLIIITLSLGIQLPMALIAGSHGRPRFTRTCCFSNDIFPSLRSLGSQHGHHVDAAL